MIMIMGLHSPHVSSNPHPLESQLTKIIIAEDWFQWSVISEAYSLWVDFVVSDRPVPVWLK